MRILHTIGPVDSDALLSAARWQVAQKCHVVLATPRAAPLAEAGRAAGLTLEPHGFETRGAGREALYLRTAVRKHNIELIHAHDAVSSLQVALCADLCPIVLTVGAAEAARLIESADGALAFDHLVVDGAPTRDRLVKAGLAMPEHVSVLSGGLEARMTRLLEAYERAIVRSLTGRAIPARFVGGRPELRRLAPVAAE